MIVIQYLKLIFYAFILQNKPLFLQTDEDLVPLPPGQDEMMFISRRLEVNV